MRLSKSLRMGSVLLLVAFAFAAFAPAGSAEAASDLPTIAEIVYAAANGAEPEFTILLFALEQTGLDAALDGRRQFTVFAPTDAAFLALIDKVGEDAFNAIVSDPAALANILLYHVSPGQRYSNAVLTANRLRMMNKGFNFVSVSSAGAFLIDTNELTDDAQIIAADIDASNGVVHVIDEVLLP